MNIRHTNVSVPPGSGRYIDSRVLSLPSKVSILVNMFGCSSSFLVIVGAFAEALIPLDARKESEENDRHGLDLVLALMNPEEAFK